MPEETTVTTEAQGNTGSPEGGVSESVETPETITPNPDPEQETSQGAQPAPGEASAESATPEQPKEEFGPPEEPQTPEEIEAAAQLPATPDGYRVNLPEGVQADPVLVEGLKRYAHRNGWTQTQVDGMADFWGGYVEFQKKQHGKQLKSWDTEIRSDWGRDYTANRQTALRGLNVAGEKIGKELTDLLNQSGMSNNPAVNRFLYAVGQLMSEDTFVRGAPNPVTVKRDEDGRPIMKFKNM